MCSAKHPLSLYGIVSEVKRVFGPKTELEYTLTLSSWEALREKSDMNNERFRIVAEELVELQKRQLALVDELYIAATNGNKIDWFPDRSFNAAPVPASAAPSPRPAAPERAPVPAPSAVPGTVNGIIKTVTRKESQYGDGANIAFLVGKRTAYGTIWLNSKNAHNAVAQLGLTAPSSLLTDNLIGRELIFTTKSSPYVGKDGNNYEGIALDQVL